MIGKWTLRDIGGPGRGAARSASDPALEKGANMSTDTGPAAPRPPERYDVRVVLDGEEAGALNRLRLHLTERTQGAISATVSDTIRYALLVAERKVFAREDDADGQ